MNEFWDKLEYVNGSHTVVDFQIEKKEIESKLWIFKTNITLSASLPCAVSDS
jgi:hypothetical protein